MTSLASSGRGVWGLGSPASRSLITLSWKSESLKGLKQLLSENCDQSRGFAVFSLSRLCSGPTNAVGIGVDTASASARAGPRYGLQDGSFGVLAINDSEGAGAAREPKEVPARLGAAGPRRSAVGKSQMALSGGFGHYPLLLRGAYPFRATLG